MDAAIKTQPKGLMSFPEYFRRGGEPFDTAGHAPPRLNPACLGHRNGSECPEGFDCIAYLQAQLERSRRMRESMARGVYPEDQSCPRSLCSGVCRCREDINL